MLRNLKNTPVVINERRQKLWTLLTRGMKGYEIAKELNTNESTISRDIKYLAAQSQNYLNDLAKRVLFEFSNRIGAFITYTLIQAMNPDNNESSLSTKGQDEIVKKWAQNSISHVLPFLVKELNEVACRAVGQYPSGYDDDQEKFNEFVKSMQKSPRYLLDKRTTMRLLAAFRRLYPRLGYEFDKRIAKLHQTLERHRRYMERMRKKWKQQESCQHEFGEPHETLLGYDGKQCHKCGYIRKVRNRRPS